MTKGRQWSSIFQPESILNFIRSIVFAIACFYLGSAAWAAAHQPEAAAATGRAAHAASSSAAAKKSMATRQQMMETTMQMMLLMYGRLTIMEETEMRAQFGEAHARYARRTPRFFPRWGQGATAG